MSLQDLLTQCHCVNWHSWSDSLNLDFHWQLQKRFNLMYRSAVEMAMVRHYLLCHSGQSSVHYLSPQNTLLKNGKNSTNGIEERSETFDISTATIIQLPTSWWMRIHPPGRWFDDATLTCHANLELEGRMWERQWKFKQPSKISFGLYCCSSQKQSRTRSNTSNNPQLYRRYFHLEVQEIATMIRLHLKTILVLQVSSIESNESWQ